MARISLKIGDVIKLKGRFKESGRFGIIIDITKAESFGEGGWISFDYLIMNKKHFDILHLCNKFMGLVNKVKPNTYKITKDHPRLVIPFLNEHDEIEFYQTRTVLNKDKKTRPKYLGKVCAEKTLFNIDKVSSNHDCVYIFEGPINAFFTKNSVAVAGITERGRSFTQRQEAQLNTTLKWYDKAWILDSQWVDQASLVKSEVLLKQGERVFIWPEKFGRRFKDFNDIAIVCKVDEIKPEFIQKNTFDGIEGIVRLSEIKKYRNQTYLN